MATFGDGEGAWNIVSKFFTQSIYPNLLDSHPPFQIDGNFGGIAAVVEAITGFYDGKVHLLPALPEQWHTGHLYGIKVPGGHLIDVGWRNEDGSMRTENAVLKALDDKKPDTGIHPHG